MVIQLLSLALTPAALRLAARAAPAVIRAVPAGTLARVGLARVSMLAPLPIVGGVVTGAVVTALLFPQSRNWIKEKGEKAYGWALDSLKERGSLGESVQSNGT